MSNRSSLAMPVNKFLPLHELLLKLGNSSQEGQMIPSPGLAETELNSERFLYKSGLSCPWHEVMTETNACSSATTTRLCYTVLDLCCQHYKIPLVGGKHIPRSVQTDPVGKEWAIPDIKPRVLRNSVVRKPGEFTSEDVRLKTTDVKEEIVFEEGKAGADAPEMKCNVVKNMLPPGTISDYMGAVTESVSNVTLSDCSTDTEFVSMDSISDVVPKRQVQAPVVVKGLGRGSVLPGRKMSRLAATFPGVDKSDLVREKRSPCDSSEKEAAEKY